MDAETPQQWICVGSYLGIDGDLQADLLVTNLQGADIPAVRLPILPTTVLPMANWPMIRPARVFVPKEYGPIARRSSASSLATCWSPRCARSSGGPSPWPS
jgi:hypothetical protein